MSSLFDLSGKVCVVIGGTAGIGRATSVRMLEHGARVVVTSRDHKSAETRAGELNGTFGEGRALGIRFDLGEREHARALIDEVVEKWGRIDTLMCNAAHIALGRLETLDDEMELLDASFRTNVRNYAALTKFAVPVMRRQGGGSVIYVSSTAGFIGAPPFLPYGLAKAALAHLTKILAVDFGADNIRVNAIVPGAIRTGTSALQKSGAAEMYVAKIPISRRGEPDEIAGMAVLLASPSGAYITGQSIVIDGGSLLKGMEGITEGYDFAATQWAADKGKAAEAASFYALTPKAGDGSG